MARPRSRPRSPFVVTVALAAAAGACGGSTTNDHGSGTGGKGGTGVGATGGSGGGTVGGSGGTGAGGSGGSPFGGTGGDYFGGYGGCGANPPHIPCPDPAPAEDSACPQANECGWWGTDCSYPDPCGGTTPLVFDCQGPTWKKSSGTSTCTSCPATEPVAGAPCAMATDQTCSYPTQCCSVAYTCTAGKWTPVPVICNPPALICPESPPAPGTPCSSCAISPQCTWDTCATLGKMTNATCVSGAWSVTGSPCIADAGVP